MRLAGLYVPLVTPFDSTGAVAFDALAMLAHQVLDGGATGIVALGTTAEPGALSATEQRGVVDRLTGICRERGAPLLVGANTVEAVLALADRPGVSAALTLVPPFVRPGDAGVLAYFTQLARSSPVPLVVYHIPHRTGQPLATDTLLRLAELPAVAGIKYAAGGIDADTMAFLAGLPPDFAVLGGEDAVISPLLALGAHGGVLTSAHISAACFAALIRTWQAGHIGRAQALGLQLAALSDALFAAPNPAVIKGVLHAQGRIPTPDVRLPLLPADPDHTRVAIQRLEAVTGSFGG
ncbi:MAG TPA: dihydrodipicolinate synthase family protein [Micromonosporaceae bacterium]